MRGIQYQLRLANPNARASAIAKLDHAESDRLAELRAPLPGRPLAGPIHTIGHAVDRAIVENV